MTGRRTGQPSWLPHRDERETTVPWPPGVAAACPHRGPGRPGRLLLGQSVQGHRPEHGPDPDRDRQRRQRDDLRYEAKRSDLDKERAEARVVLRAGPGCTAGQRTAGQGRQVSGQGRPRQPAAGDPAPAAAGRRRRTAAVLLHEPDAGRREPGHELRQVQGQADQQGHAEDDLCRRRGRGRGDRGTRRDQTVPREPGEVPGRRGQDPEGRAPVRATGNRQDAARPGSSRRGGGAVLLDFRLRLRRDVRRRRREPRPGPVRAGQDQRTRDHLRGRDRRRRTPPRRRPRRRARRA